jgi:toxin ParE1/3/4
MRIFRFSPEAARDIRAIWRYIARDNERAADRVYDQLLRAADMLGRNPRLGHVRPDFTDKPLLFWPVESHVLVYRLEKPLQIVRVLHGAQDLKSILR